MISSPTNCTTEAVVLMPRCRVGLGPYSRRLHGATDHGAEAADHVIGHIDAWVAPVRVVGTRARGAGLADPVRAERRSGFSRLIHSQIRSAASALATSPRARPPTPSQTNRRTYRDLRSGQLRVS